MFFLAHIAEDGREQTVAEHLRGTAALAKRFAAVFGAESDAELAGLLHDIGKCTPEFQARLHGGAIVDHSTAGAKLAFSRRNLPAALAMAEFRMWAIRKPTDRTKPRSLAGCSGR